MEEARITSPISGLGRWACVQPRRSELVAMDALLQHVSGTYRWNHRQFSKARAAEASVRQGWNTHTPLQWYFSYPKCNLVPTSAVAEAPWCVWARCYPATRKHIYNSFATQCSCQQPALSSKRRRTCGFLSTRVSARAKHHQYRVMHGRGCIGLSLEPHAIDALGGADGGSPIP